MDSFELSHWLSNEVQGSLRCEKCNFNWKWTSRLCRERGRTNGLLVEVNILWMEAISSSISQIMNFDLLQIQMCILMFKNDTTYRNLGTFYLLKKICVPVFKEVTNGKPQISSHSYGSWHKLMIANKDGMLFSLNQHPSRYE